MPLPLVAMGASAFIASTLSTIVFRIFVALGIGVATYSGASVVVDKAEIYMKARLAEINTVAPQVFDVLIYIGIDNGLSMIFASIVAVSALKALRWVKK